MSMPLIERGDEFSPDQIRFADAKTAVMLVVLIGALDHLDGEPRDLLGAKLDHRGQPDFARDFAAGPGAEAVAGNFADFDRNGPLVALAEQLGRAFDGK